MDSPNKPIQFVLRIVIVRRDANDGRKASCAGIQESAARTRNADIDRLACQLRSNAFGVEIVNREADDRCAVSAEIVERHARNGSEFGAKAICQKAAASLDPYHPEIESIVDGRSQSEPRSIVILPGFETARVRP